VSGECVDCGHPAGHHDDEPAGCWDCDCTAWSGQTDAEWEFELEVTLPANWCNSGTCGCPPGACRLGVEPRTAPGTLRAMFRPST